VVGIKQLILRLTLIAAACLYPLSLALLMLSKMRAITWLANTPAQPAVDVMTHILGDRAQLWLFLFAAIGAWTVVPRRSRTLMLAPSILLLGVMIDPLLTRFLQTHLFTPNTYWRGLWVLPWLIWSAILICGLSSLAGALLGRTHKPLSRGIAVSVTTGILIFTVFLHPIWRRQNGTRLQFAGLAVDEGEYAVAQKLVAQTPPGTAALAPELVACWTAVQDQRPPLIFVRSFYTQSSPENGGIEDVRMRNHLGEIAGKANLDQSDIAVLLTGANRYRLGSIVLAKNAGDAVANSLEKAGFCGEAIGKYSLWIQRRF
jgi:hypothetical protein